MLYSILALEKQTRIDSVHPLSMKIDLYTKNQRLRASPGHGEEAVVVNFAHRSAAGASLLGRQSSYQRERATTFPESELSSTIFTGYAQYQS